MIQDIPEVLVGLTAQRLLKLLVLRITSLSNVKPALVTAWVYALSGIVTCTLLGPNFVYLEINK